MKPSPKREPRLAPCPFCKVTVKDGPSTLFYCEYCSLHFDFDSNQKLNVLRYSGMAATNERISHIIMRVDRGMTYINYKNPVNGHYVKEFSGAWPDTQPSDIMELALRLEKLTAFA